MAELLLINPRKRGRKAKSATRRRRRRNPTTAKVAAPFARRAPSVFPNPRKRRSRRRRSLGSSVFRRRRNPIRARGLFAGVVPLLKDAAVGAVGAVGVELAMGQVNKYLPDNLKATPTKIGAGDAIKLATAIVLGKLLSRPTRGLSNRMAEGAVTVQLHELIRRHMPATMPLAYASPARIVRGSPRIGPNTIAAFTTPGSGTPLLSAFTRPGSGTPLLSGRRNTIQRREMGPVR